MIGPKFYLNLPNSPGVYLFKDKLGNILYVGKAINLRKRVNNYFEKKISENRINYLLEEAEKIDYILVNSEVEALLLEARLIKQYKPKFNVRLKDDKRFLYAGISKEDYPRVFLLRKPEQTQDLLAWFGPFPSAQSIKEILRLLRRIFPYRSCRKMPKKVCLYYHLNLCPGMCQYPVEKEFYLTSIKKIKLFLEGRISLLVKKLEKEMKKAADNLAFEEAQNIHRQIEMIKNMLGKFKKMPEEEQIKKALEWLRKIAVRYQKIEPGIIHRLEAYDIANLGKEIIVGSMVVFINGEPQASLYRQFKIKSPKGGDPQALEEIISRRLKHQEWVYPQLILVDGGKPQLSAAFSALRKANLSSQIPLFGLEKGKETIIIPLIEEEEIRGYKQIKNSSRAVGLPILQFARDEAHRFAQRYYKKLYRKFIFSGQE